MKHLNFPINKVSDPENLNDWDLFISKGCENAFSKIYHNHFDTLYHIGLKYSTDNQTIEDSIQNLFTYLLKNRKKLNPVNNIQAYLIKSFRRQLFKDLKKQKKLILPDQIIETQTEHYSSTEQIIIKNEEITEIQTALKKCLNKLTSKQQEIIYLRFDCEMSYNEISNILDINVESCYKSIYRLIKIIKEDIEKINIKSKDFLLWFVYRLEKSF